MLKNKKSDLSINMLVLLSLGAIVFLVLIFLVPNLLGKSTVEANNNIQGSDDFDKDGVANYWDKCICIPAETEDGCPPSTNPPPDDPAHNPYDKCTKNQCPSWKPDCV